MRVSVSSISLYDDCLRQWDYKASHRRNLEPKKPRHAPLFGTSIHEALAAHYSGQTDRMFDVFGETFDEPLIEYSREFPNEYSEDEDRLLKQRELGIGVLKHYKDAMMPTDDFEAIEVEREFECGIPGTDGAFIGKVDAIICDSQERWWIMEHKTYSVEPPPEFLLLDRQTLLYQWACGRLIREGYFPNIPKDAALKGVLYNGLRKKLPTVPRLLKSGELSRAVSIDTTAAVYAAEIERCGLNPSGYGEMLEMLAARGNPFFKREYVRRGVAELESIERQLAAVYRRMQATDEVYPRPTWDCSWKCDYRDLCVQEQSGADTSDLLNTRYRQRPRKG